MEEKKHGISSIETCYWVAKTAT